MKKWLVLFLVVLVVAGGSILLRAENEKKHVVAQITSAQYAKADPETIHVMLIGFEGCAPCRLAENTVFLPLAEYYADDPQVQVVKVDTVQDAKETAEEERIVTRFQVSKLPAILVVYHQGIMWRQDGFSLSKKDALKDSIIKAVSNLK